MHHNDTLSDLNGLFDKDSTRHTHMVYMHDNGTSCNDALCETNVGRVKEQTQLHFGAYEVKLRLVLHVEIIDDDKDGTR